MKRFAIYARFSSENQNEKSVDDQVRECRKKIKELGGTIAEGHVFADYAISGSHLTTRPGVNALIEAAKCNLFDAVVAEDLSRLSRDQENIAGLYKRLNHQNIKLITLLEGEVDEMHIGFKGTQNALFLKQLAHGVRRGQRGRVEQGRIPGGNCYGYDMVRELDSYGEIIRGVRKLNPEQSAIVCRIFREYVAGKSPRAIAHQLNRENIEGPRGGQWQGSTINGNPERRTGILNNDLYNGKIVYNRQTFRKDPDTGKRQARPNPKESWLIQDVPELRLVPQDLWDAAQARREEVANNGFKQGPRPKHLLSGLLKCHCCGGSYAVISGARNPKGKRMGCSVRKERGTCDNERTITVQEVEDRIFDGLRRYLSEPKGLRFFVQEFHRHLKELKAEETQERARLEKAQFQAEKKIKALIQAIEDGMYDPDMKQRVADLRSEKERLDLEIAQMGQNDRVIDFLPNIGATYEKYIDDMRHAIGQEDTKGEAIAILRGLIDKIVLTPRKEASGLDIEIQGNLAAILHFINGEPEPLKKTLAPSAKRLVAGVGFEPTTFRL
jgi:site-specific DNA recombinase